MSGGRGMWKVFPAGIGYAAYLSYVRRLGHGLIAELFPFCEALFLLLIYLFCFLLRLTWLRIGLFFLLIFYLRVVCVLTKFYTRSKSERNFF